MGKNEKEVIKKNYENKIEKIKRIIHIWKQRNLSLTGKILTVKATALSQVIHLANLMPFPDEYVKKKSIVSFTSIFGMVKQIKLKVIFSFKSMRREG